MFSLFSKNKPDYQLLEDKIWLKKAAKYWGICVDMEENKQNFRFVVTYFPKTLEELKMIFEHKNLQFEVFNHNERLEVNSFNKQRIVLMSNDWLLNNSIHGMESSGLGAKGSFLFAEHHPKFTVRQNSLKRLEETAVKSDVRFYSSIEDPIFQLFGGENLKTMMLKMNVKDEESLSHSMISKSIINGQKKIDEKVIAEYKADSPEEWLKVNMNR